MYFYQANKPIYMEKGMPTFMKESEVKVGAEDHSELKGKNSEYYGFSQLEKENTAYYGLSQLEGKNLEDYGLSQILKNLCKTYPLLKPNEEEVKRTVISLMGDSGINPGDVILFATLAYQIFKDMFLPDINNRISCEWIYNGDKCGLDFIQSEKRAEAVYRWCARGHETIIPIQAR